MNVLVLVGSLRADSFNVQLATAAADLLPAGVTWQLSDHLPSLPFYSEDLDRAGAPESVQAFRAAVAAADALIIATPEYNGSVSAPLKNAIDWASRPREDASLAGKPVAVLAASAAPRGAQWAREDLVRILTVAGARPIATTVGIGSGYETLADGVPADTEAQLLGLVHTLVSEVPAAA